MRLDELLQELLDRVSEVMASRERLRNLLDAVVDIGVDLDLRSNVIRHANASRLDVTVRGKGGTMTTGRADAGGTLLTWEVPL